MTPHMLSVALYAHLVDVYVSRFQGFSDPPLPSTMHRSPKAILSKSFTLHNKKWQPHHRLQNLTIGLPEQHSFLIELSCLLLITILLKENYRSRFTVVPLSELFLFKCISFRSWFCEHVIHHTQSYAKSMSLTSYISRPAFRMIPSNGERVSPSYPGALAGRLYGTKI